MKQYLGNNCTVEILPFEKSKQNLITDKLGCHGLQETEDAFFICDLGDIIHKHKTWMTHLPRVHPFYAVKCNDSPAVLKTLVELGTSFDCASKAEIDKVLKLGVDPSRIIFANPCKQASFIRHARKTHVSVMTFDNEAELHKIKSIYPEAKLVLRVLPPSDFKVQCELGIKFGCHPKSTYHLLEVAKGLGLNVMGVSFHVGSGCEDARAFEAAITVARGVFDQGLELGFKMTLLDIGGGFPGQKSAPISFKEIAAVVTDALDEYFPVGGGVQVIAEPGRFFVASAFTLAVNVIAKRVVARDADTSSSHHGSSLQVPTQDEEPAYMYYVNDGVYGSFNCLLYDHAQVTAQVLQEAEEELMFTSSIWGPTCDGLDCILQGVLLPQLTIGQWLYFEDMGAYTMCAASTFNGMPKPRCHYYSNKDPWCTVFPTKPKKAELCICAIPQMKAGHQCADTCELGLTQSKLMLVTDDMCTAVNL